MNLFLYQIYILGKNVGVGHLKRISIWGELKCEINCIFVNLVYSAKEYSYWPLQICIGHLSGIYWTLSLRSLNYTVIFSDVIIM